MQESHGRKREKRKSKNMELSGTIRSEINLYNKTKTDFSVSGYNQENISTTPNSASTQTVIEITTQLMPLHSINSSSQTIHIFKKNLTINHYEKISSSSSNSTSTTTTTNNITMPSQTNSQNLFHLQETSTSLNEIVTVAQSEEPVLEIISNNEVLDLESITTQRNTTDVSAFAHSRTTRSAERNSFHSSTTSRSNKLKDQSTDQSITFSSIRFDSNLTTISHYTPTYDSSKHDLSTSQSHQRNPTPSDLTTHSSSTFDPNSRGSFPNNSSFQTSPTGTEPTTLKDQDVITGTR